MSKAQWLTPFARLHRKLNSPEVEIFSVAIAGTLHDLATMTIHSSHGTLRVSLPFIPKKAWEHQYAFISKPDMDHLFRMIAEATDKGVIATMTKDDLQLTHRFDSVSLRIQSVETPPDLTVQSAVELRVYSADILKWLKPVHEIIRLAPHDDPRLNQIILELSQHKGQTGGPQWPVLFPMGEPVQLRAHGQNRQGMTGTTYFQTTPITLTDCSSLRAISPNHACGLLWFVPILSQLISAEKRNNSLEMLWSHPDGFFLNASDNSWGLHLPWEPATTSNFAVEGSAVSQPVQQVPA